MKHIFSKKIVWFLIPVVCVALAVAAFFMYGSIANQSINSDFYVSGGTIMSVAAGKEAVDNYDASVSKIENVLYRNGVDYTNAEYELSTQDYKDQAKIIVRYSDVKGADMTQLNVTISEQLAAEFAEFATVENIVSYDTVNKSLMESTILNALLAVGIALLIIPVYMLFRYGWANALSGLLSSLIALVVFISLIVLTHIQINNAIIGIFAYVILATAVGNIVVFDKVKYLRKKLDFKGTKAEAQNVVGTAVCKALKGIFGFAVVLLLSALIFAIVGTKGISMAALAVICGTVAAFYSVILFAPNLSVILITAPDKKKAKAKK